MALIWRYVFISFMRIVKYPTLLLLSLLLSGLGTLENHAFGEAMSYQFAQVDELPPPPPSFSIELPEMPKMPEAPDIPLPEEELLETINIPSIPTLPEGNISEEENENTEDTPFDLLPSPPTLEELEALDELEEKEKNQPFGTSNDPNAIILEDEQPFEITPLDSIPSLPDAPSDKQATFPQCQPLIDNLKNCTLFTCTTDPLTRDGKEINAITYTVDGLQDGGCGLKYTDPDQGELHCMLSDHGTDTFIKALEPFISEGQWNPDSEFTQIVQRDCSPIKAEITPVASDDGPRRPRSTGLILPELEGKKITDDDDGVSCSQYPNMLKRCAPYSCEQPSFDADDGDFLTKRTVLGLDEGLCEYRETLPHGATLQCRYSERARNATSVFHRMLFNGTYEAGTNDEILYNKARRNECRIIGENGKEIDYDFFIDFKNLPIEVSKWGDPETPEGDCATLNEKLKSCEPFYCKGSDPVQEKFFNRKIMVERKIIGSFDNTCYYLDQMDEKPLSGCKYSKTETTSGSRCSDGILIEIADKGGMFANLTEAEKAATTGASDTSNVESSGSDPILTVYKAKLNELPKLDYKTKVLSPLIHKKEYQKQNTHLPISMYLEEFKYMAFDALNKGDITTLHALINRLTKLYAKEDHNQDEEKRIWNGLDARGKHGNTLLIHSIMAGRYTAARMLLGRGANPDAKNAEGTTALHAAVFSGRMDMTNLLLDMGAKVNIADNYGRTALTFASDKGYNDILQALLKKRGNPNMAMDGGTTPLITVVMQNNEHATRNLLKNGADVNYPDNSGMTALMHAAGLGYAPLIDMLLQNGADIFAQDHLGRTAEMLAAQAGHIHTARHLASLAIDKRMQ